MPTPDALQMLLKGDQIKPAAAKAKHLVHALAPRAEIVGEGQGMDQGGRQGRRALGCSGLEGAIGQDLFARRHDDLAAGQRHLPPQTFDNYPAARAILQSVYEGLQLPMDLALRVESRWFAKILRSPEAAAMIRSLFVSMGELNKGARRPKNILPTTIKKIGVLGAGFMGAGIAYVSVRWQGSKSC